jgi:hypothetical protein
MASILLGTNQLNYEGAFDLGANDDDLLELLEENVAERWLIGNSLVLFDLSIVYCLQMLLYSCLAYFWGHYEYNLKLGPNTHSLWSFWKKLESQFLEFWIWALCAADQYVLLEMDFVLIPQVFMDAIHGNLVDWGANAVL